LEPDLEPKLIVKLEPDPEPDKKTKTNYGSTTPDERYGRHSYLELSCFERNTNTEILKHKST
jgi:hypothetical protein